jgi:predicted membrane-bound spermidine synthase
MANNHALGFRIAAPLSFVAGFLSLSQEMIWVRWVGFGHGGAAQSFSWVLVSFLVGIAVGALFGKWRCSVSQNLIFDAGFIFILAGLFDAVVLYAAPFAMIFHPLSFGVQFVLVGLAAGIKGTLFPIVHQLGITSTVANVGKSFSRVYGANIAGSTLGPLVTGFVLLNYFTAAQIYGAVALTSLAIGFVLVWPWRATLTISQGLLASLLMIALAGLLIRAPDPVVRVANSAKSGGKISAMVQNRQGIVHMINTQEPGGLVTFGGNIYDGRTGFDMNINANRLDRAYFMATVHAAPKRVLVIGLSTGAWTKVILGMPGIEQVDVVEINPAYAQLMANDADLREVFGDPRLTMHWGDGRRWLRANPDKKYDLIVQNTTFHWRAYITLLASQDYFLEVKPHLLAGGIMGINTTDSPDIFYTAAKTFESSVRYENFVYVSNQPIQRRADAQQVLQDCWVIIGGQKIPAFAPALFAPNRIGANLLNAPLEPAINYAAKLLGGKRNPEVITDLNLITEYRYGRSILGQ